MDFTNKIISMFGWFICIAAVCIYFFNSTKNKNKAMRGTYRAKPIKKTTKNRQENQTVKIQSAKTTPKNFSDRISIILDDLYSFIIKYEWYFFAGLMLIGAFIRLFRFGTVPGGLNQDEASIGYDSWALANFGIDRNNHHWPVEAIAWGSGHGPLYMYLTIPFIKLFGLSVFVYRLPNVILGIASMAFFYFAIKKAVNVKTALMGLLLIVVNPWHIISSRWALDANPLSFVFMISVYLFLLASERKKTWIYALSAFMASVSMHAYGPGIVVAPIFLMLSCAYMFYHKRLTLKQILIGAAVFTITALPYGIFMIINMFDLPPILTDYISFGKFTVARSSSVFIRPGPTYLSDILNNLKNFYDIIIGQKQDWIWNMVPGYGTVYMYASPLIILGLISLARECFNLKRYKGNIIFLNWLIGASIYCVLVHQNVNRIGIVFFPIVFLVLSGALFVARQSRLLFSSLIAMTLISFSLFGRSYFTTYPDQINPAFFETFGDAVTEAMDRTEGTICVTNTGVNGSGVVTLFYSKINPYEFYDTVVYRDPNAEFRDTISYGRFTFGLPEYKDPSVVYVFHNSEAHEFDQNIFDIKAFKYFSVAYKK